MSTDSKGASRPLEAATVERIEAILDGVAREAAPGLATAVILDGAVVHTSCRGLANLEYDIPITEQTTFHIASMSKQFTAFAVALLADKGVLDLDADVRAYLPYFPDLGVPISARQLVHHTSGLRDQWATLLLSGWRIDDVITTGDVLSMVRRVRTLNFAPGTGFSYSNTGYTLLGELVRTVDGRSLREFCGQEIFAPLGMSSTHFHDDHCELVPGRAYSYRPVAEGGFQHVVLSYATVGPSSLHTTVGDLALWDHNFYDHKVGNEAVFGLIHESGVLADGTATNYAWGLMLGEHRGLERVEHSGGDAGFRTHMARLPAERLSVVALCNAADRAPSSVTASIADCVLDQLGVQPAAQPATADAQDLQQYAGLFADQHTGESQTIAITEDGALALMGLPLRSTGADTFAAGPLNVAFEPTDAPAWVEIEMPAQQRQRLTRIEALQPTTTDLESCVGTYWGEELETGYRATLGEEGLTLHHAKHGTFALTPLLRDRFQGTMPAGWMSLSLGVAFDRDDTGVVRQMRLTTSRVTNVALTKTD